MRIAVRMASVTMIGLLAIGTLAGCADSGDKPSKAKQIAEKQSEERFVPSQERNQIKSDVFAKKVSEVLSETVGQKAEVTCGDDPVPLQIGTNVLCTLVDPVDGSEYEVQATLGDVASLDDWGVSVVVSDTPIVKPE